MVDAFSHNRKRVLPCVSILEGEFGQHDIAVGVPAVLGRLGLERVIELPLNEAEKRMFDQSVAMIREDISKLASRLV